MDPAGAGKVGLTLHLDACVHPYPVNKSQAFRGLIKSSGQQIWVESEMGQLSVL